MHRVDTSGATSDNLFTDGDPVAGVEATVVDAAYMNAIQEEMAGVIEGAGITLDKTNTGQLAEAIAALFGGSSAETFRKSRIGTAMPVASTSLDDSYKIADGSLVLFADYPELEAKYEANGLMVLDADSTADEQAAKPLYFVANSDATGLYLPRLGGLFARSWTGTDDGTAGGYNEAGVPNIEGSIAIRRGVHSNGNVVDIVDAASEALTLTNDTWTVSGRVTLNGEVSGNRNVINIDGSNSNNIYGNSATVMPESYNQPIAIYLGQCATTQE